MNQVRVHIGVDVGKEWLDICYPDGEKEKVRNIKPRSEAQKRLKKSVSVRRNLVSVG